MSQDKFNLFDELYDNEEMANSINDIININEIQNDYNINNIENDQLFDINERKSIKDPFYNKKSKIIEENIIQKQLNCFQCEGIYKKCSICDGLFDLNFFKNEHYFTCNRLNFDNKIISSCINCSACKALIQIENFQEHAKTCRVENKKEHKIDKFECVHCKKSIEIYLIDEHEKICEQNLNQIYLMTTNSKCSICCKDFPEINLREHIQQCEILYKQKCFLANKQKQLKFEFPETWLLDINSLPPNIDKAKLKIVFEPDISYYSLDANDIEFNFVCDLLRVQIIGEQLIPQIKDIRRVQNKIIYKKFEIEKMKIIEEKGYAKERTLFFYDQNISIDYLIKNGFDISFANDNSEFGRGIHFYKEAKYPLELIMNSNSINNNNNNNVSNNQINNQNNNIILNKKVVNQLRGGLNVLNSNNIAPQFGNNQQKQKYLAVSKVIIGMKYLQAQPNNALKKPPYLNNQKTIMFDSIKNKKNNPDRRTTYVVYDNDKAYPEYIIEFL